MKNKGIERDTIFGIFAVIAGIVFGTTWGFRFIISLFDNVGSGFAFFILLMGSILSFVCFLLAGKAFMRLSKYKRYSYKIGKSPRFRIPALAAALKKSENIVFSELDRMVHIGYFGDAEIDLLCKELVIDKASEPLDVPDSELMSMYKQHKKFPFLPIASGLAAFTAFSVYSYGGAAGLITGGAVGVFMMIIAFYFFPAPVYFTETARPIPKPKPVSKTGNPELDALLDSASKAEAEMLRIESAVKRTAFGKTISELVHLLGEITTHVTNYPEKVRQLRQFSAYYLPTTVRLAQSYEELCRVSDKGENVTQSIAKIEAMGEKITGVFKHEYDQLFGDKAMDISAEIAVMEGMIDETKADTDPFK